MTQPTAPGADTPSATPVMLPILRWQGLPAEVAADTSLPPGVHLLLDEEDGPQHLLLAWLSGRQPLPSSAQLHCADQPLEWAQGATQLCWLDARQPWADAPVLDWLTRQRQHWPHWDEAAWQAHVRGFELAEHQHKHLHQLSTGTLRKFLLAASLASGAPLTLISEPTAGLDKASIAYLIVALQASKQSCANAGLSRWLLVAHFDRLGAMAWSSVVTLGA